MIRMLIVSIAVLLVNQVMGQSKPRKMDVDSIAGKAWHDFNAKHGLSFSIGGHYSHASTEGYLKPPSSPQVNLTSPYFGYYSNSTYSFHGGIFYTRFFPHNYLKVDIGLLYFNRKSNFTQSDTTVSKQYHTNSYLITEYDVSPNNIEIPILLSYYQGPFSIGGGVRYSILSYEIANITSLASGEYKRKEGWEADLDRFIPSVQASYKLKIGNYRPALYLAIDRRSKRHHDIQAGISYQLKKW